MESFGPDLANTPRKRLLPEHVDELTRIGEVVTFTKGEVVWNAGDSADHLFYILEGEIELLDPFTMEPYLEYALGPTQFSGDITLLYGGSFTITSGARSDVRAIKIARDPLLKLIARNPELGDLMLQVFAGRRRRQIETGDSSLTLVTTSDSPRFRDIDAIATRTSTPIRRLELGTPDAATALRSAGIAEDREAVLFGKREVSDPSPRSVAALLGFDLAVETTEAVDVLIVGGGPAGVAAGVYAGAEGMSAIVIDSLAIGGQAGTSSRIENYMGFPTGISGTDLLTRGVIQAMKFGTKFAMPRRIESLTVDAHGCFVAAVDHGEHLRAKAVVVATGVQYRKLPLQRLSELEGAGIYYAATEAEARFCEDRPVVIIGAGNSAGQAAMHLSRRACHVHVLIRGSSLGASMSEYLSSRLVADDRITLHFHTEVSELEGEDSLTSVIVRDRNSGESRRLDAGGLFVMIGAAPNTGWLSQLVELDDKGFIRTGDDVGRSNAFETSHERIFAVGDVRAGSVKRVASAVGEGSVVISQVWSRLNAVK